MLKNLKLGTIEYEFDENAKFEKDGRTYSFISLRKITTFKENKKYQNLTIKHEHWDQFREWLLKDVLEEEVPF